MWFMFFTEGKMWAMWYTQVMKYTKCGIQKQWSFDIYYTMNGS